MPGTVRSLATAGRPTSVNDRLRVVSGAAGRGSRMDRGRPRLDTLEVTRDIVPLSGFGIVPRRQFTSIIFSSTENNDAVYLG